MFAATAAAIQCPSTCTVPTHVYLLAAAALGQLFQMHVPWGSPQVSCSQPWLSMLDRREYREASL